jgi:hypothetical protein
VFGSYGGLVAAYFATYMILTTVYFEVAGAHAYDGESYTGVLVFFNERMNAHCVCCSGKLL